MLAAFFYLFPIHEIKPLKHKMFIYQVDLINMSYGEFSNWSHSGRLGKLVDEVVGKTGVTWVASAGNNGPALCTVGTPPDLKRNVIIGKQFISFLNISF